MVNSGSSEDNEYFVSLDPDWLYGGVKDTVNDTFIFFGTGSPAYYAGRGEDSGVNISGYSGSLTSGSLSFEVIQVRDQPPNAYIERLRSNGSHIWVQQWQGTDFPSTPADVEAVKNSPTDTRCVEIGTSVVTSKYVPVGECVTSFEVASTDDLNQDDNFTLKIFDGETAGSIDFSTSLTSVTETSCAKEGAPKAK